MGASNRRECQRLFGEQRGSELMAKIEEAIGGPCPCKLNQACPFVPVPQPGTEMVARAG